MPTIMVHLLNFHGPVTHTEIMLEDVSKKPSTYYSINQWAPPDVLGFSTADSFEQYNGVSPLAIIDQASSTFNFEIEAEPFDIALRWAAYYLKTLPKAGIITHNCGDAAQWFLTRYANIPAPNFYSTPVSINHLAFGIFVPSFIPVGVTLPGRVMSNAKFHISARDNPQAANQYSDLFLNICLAITALSIAVSVTGIILASIFLTGGLGIGVITACVVVGAASSCGLFATINARAAKALAAQPQQVGFAGEDDEVDKDRERNNFLFLCDY